VIWQVLQDLRYGKRMLRKRSLLTLASLFVIALGVGVNTALFSVVDAWLLRSLSFPDPQQLTSVWLTEEGAPSIPAFLPSFRAYDQWSRTSRSFDAIAAYVLRPATVNRLKPAQRVLGLAVSHNLFSTLGVSPFKGRTFSASDLNGPRLVVVSYAFWQRYLGGSPDIIGEPISLDDQSYTVIGVMPPSFSVPTIAVSRDREQFWTLLLPNDEVYTTEPDTPICVLARLKSGISDRNAQSELLEIYEDLERIHPIGVKGLGVLVEGLQKDLIRTVRPILLVLTGAAICSLLIVCATVANLLLSRASERQVEIAVRVALGATRPRLIRQLLTESLLLSVLGAIVGLGIAAGLLYYIHLFNPFETPAINDAGMNWRVLVFSVGLTMITAFLCGMVPALQVSPQDPNAVLKASGRNSSAGGHRRRARTGLVVGELALSLALLCAAGSMIQSFIAYTNVPLGYRTTGVATFALNLPKQRYSKLHDRSAFFDRLLENLRGLSEIRSCAITADLPTFDPGRSPISIHGHSTPSPDEKSLAAKRIVSRDYLDSVGIALVKGRQFDESDFETSEKRVIVNQEFVRQFLPNEEAIGQHLKNGEINSESPWFTIVGVVADTKLQLYGTFEWFSQPEVFFLYQQVTGFELESRTFDMTLVVEWAAGSDVSSVRRVVADLDSDVPAVTGTMNDAIAALITQPRLRATLLSSFAALTLILAVLGVYGIISQDVSQRTREFAIRLAVGATTTNVVRMVVSEGLRLAMIGVGLGLIGAFVMTRSLQSMLFAVGPASWTVYASAVLVVVSVSSIATLLPARRAVRMSVTDALRFD
jgi:predicted permease